VRAGVIIVAAGSGTRMGRPKQFLPLNGRPVVEWTIDVFNRMAEVSEIVLVMTGENLKRHGERLTSGKVRVVEGGATRMGSVRNGFDALSPTTDVVAVHDGARPLITEKTIRLTLQEAAATGACVAAVPAKDTLKEVEEDTIKATPDRARIWQAQTPQTYRRDLLSAALEKFASDADATDESQLVERLGQEVKIVPSSYENIKITTPEDLLVASAMLNARSPGLVRETRTGFGYDIHKLSAGRELWLAGVHLPHNKGLAGHSDGDAVLHAGSDAVLGALGAGEIGIAFPPTDPQFKGISSRKIVEHVMEKLHAAKARLQHIDITIVAEEPKMKPHYEALHASLAEIFSLEPGRVNLKAKSHEKMGEIGRGEAIACYAVASVSLPV
jgi:2-C-methyl-D-erythritol 4-phosphate cytidylyltransferase/2-C-methyl-D-erythritol 2,4-cyclodiphosphate synthase